MFRSRLLLVVACAISVSLGLNERTVDGAPVIVDFSPDTTGASVINANHSNLLPGQIMGDQFTLTNDTIITGASIFSNEFWGTIGDSASFRIFSNPVSPAIVEISTTIDAVDSMFTTSQTILSRKHATVAPVLLSAGTYWFSMPGAGVELAQATGNYDDGVFRFGPGILQTARISGGDAFFQLEGMTASPVPEPTSMALFGLTALGMGVMRRRRKQTSDEMT